MRKTILLLSLFLFFYTQPGVSQVYFEENFEMGLKNWIWVDADGDGSNWGYLTYDDQGNRYAVSPSYDYEEEKHLSPENWLISPLIDLTEANDKIMLSYYIGAMEPDGYAETYKIFIKPEDYADPDTAYIKDFQRQIQYETLQKWTEELEFRRINLSGWAGQKVRLAFLHTESVGQSYLVLGNIKIENASDNADLAIEEIMEPYSYGSYRLNAEIDVKFRMVNKGLNTATGVKASYTGPKGETVTEDLPDMAPGQQLTYTFTKRLPGYSEIIENGIVRVTVSASNDNTPLNNTLSTTFNAYPLTPQDNLVMQWNFESMDQETFHNTIETYIFDDYTLQPESAIFFPAGKGWTICRGAIDAEDYPYAYWGEKFAISSSAFTTTDTKADRWMILPKTLLKGSQVMLTCTTAMYGLAMITSDEGMEILISDTGNNIEDFVSLGSYVIRNSFLAPSAIAINISEYAGKEVYIAFRNNREAVISAGPTLLALDNIRIFSDEGGYYTNIEETKEENINVNLYPNPATDLINIEIEGENIKSIYILNTAGQTVLSHQTKETNIITLDVSNLPEGIYLVRIQTQDGKELNKKIIKI